MKAFASDFDGTLYRNQTISQEDIHSIQTFQKENIFGICTGRSLTGIESTIQNQITFDFYILASGSVILNAKKEYIYTKRLEADIVQTIYQQYPDIPMVIHANNTVYTYHKPLPMQIHIEDIKEIGPMIFGISFGLKSLEQASWLATQINQEYSSHLMAYQNQNHVDITPIGCSKGHAIEILKERFNIKKIGGIGDSYNDLPMLEKVDSSFTFDYAPDIVKQNSDYIVDSVSQALKSFD